MPITNWGLTTRIPIWVRVPGIIALILVGVLASTVLLGAAGVGGGAGPDKHAPAQHQNQGQQMDSGDGGVHRPPAGGHR